MKCRIGCAACCIAISISESIPNHPNGKAAGERCKNLDDSNACKLWNSDAYPTTCKGFTAEKIFCGSSNEEAFQILTDLEFS